MKTEVIQQINVKIEKDEKELIEKVNALINDLVDKGIEYKIGWYKINNIHYDITELDNLTELLKNLTCTKVIELT